MKEEKLFSPLHLILCGLFAALIAAGSFLRIPIPPMPITLQIFFTTMAGMVLGKKLGAISVALYIFIGLIGVPIFSTGGGLGYLLQPSFGYLPGFVAGAYFCGFWLEKKHNCSVSTLTVACIGNILLIYLIGCSYAAMISACYTHQPLAIGTLVFSYFLLFLPGEFVKMLLVILICKKWLPLFRKLAHIPL